MTLSIYDSYSYISFSCFQDDLPSVLKAARNDEILRPVEGGGATALELSRIYREAPSQSGAEPANVVLFAPDATPNRTVMFASPQDGWNSMNYRLARHVPNPAFWFAISSDADRWPCCAFQVIRNGKQVRHVSAMKDSDRWVFWQKGDPLASENTDDYKRRRVRDRLNRESLVTLANRLGFPIEQDSFWQSNQAFYFAQEFGAMES